MTQKILPSTAIHLCILTDGGESFFLELFCQPKSVALSISQVNYPRIWQLTVFQIFYNTSISVLSCIDLFPCPIRITNAYIHFVTLCRFHIRKLNEGLLFPLRLNQILVGPLAVANHNTIMTLGSYYSIPVQIIDLGSVTQNKSNVFLLTHGSDEKCIYLGMWFLLLWFLQQDNIFFKHLNKRSRFCMTLVTLWKGWKW